MNRRSFVSGIVSALAAIPLAAVGAKLVAADGASVMKNVRVDKNGVVHIQGRGAVIENCTFENSSPGARVHVVG